MVKTRPAGLWPDIGINPPCRYKSAMTKKANLQTCQRAITSTCPDGTLAGPQIENHHYDGIQETNRGDAAAQLQTHKAQSRTLQGVPGGLRAVWLRTRRSARR